ncbi:MAG: molybdenum cofactor guanylyltransferase [Leptospirales bacterium]
MVKPEIVGVILAGGKSLRMGQDKSLLSMADKGITFLEHLHCVFSTFFNQVIVVSNRRDDRHSGFLVCRDSEEGLGPLGGILSAYEHADHLPIFVCACDMPGISQDTIAFFLERIDRANVSVAISKNTMEPLFSFFPREVESDLLEYVHRGGRSVKAFILGRAYCPVVFPDPLGRSIENINTPGEYEQYLDSSQRRRAGMEAQSRSSLLTR